jgi:hypothetical protein
MDEGSIGLQRSLRKPALVQEMLLEAIMEHFHRRRGLVCLHWRKNLPLIAKIAE